MLWRQKEQFSDGVGYSWIDGLKAHAERVITDTDMETMGVRFPYNTPATKEALYFRTIFHSHFPNNDFGNGIEKTVPGGPSVACSTAKAIEWDAAFSNPENQDQSGRMVDVHDSTVDVGAMGEAAVKGALPLEVKDMGAGETEDVAQAAP